MFIQLIGTLQLIITATRNCETTLKNLKVTKLTYTTQGRQRRIGQNSGVCCTGHLEQKLSNKLQVNSTPLSSSVWHWIKYIFWTHLCHHHYKRVQYLRFKVIRTYAIKCPPLDCMHAASRCATACIPARFSYHRRLHLWRVPTHALLLVYHGVTFETARNSAERNLIGLSPETVRVKPPVHFLSILSQNFAAALPTCGGAPSHCSHTRLRAARGSGNSVSRKSL
jgi:hypothetical protein